MPEQHIIIKVNEQIIPPGDGSLLAPGTGWFGGLDQTGSLIATIILVLLVSGLAVAIIANLRRFGIRRASLMNAFSRLWLAILIPIIGLILVGGSVAQAIGTLRLDKDTLTFNFTKVTSGISALSSLSVTASSNPLSTLSPLGLSPTNSQDASFTTHVTFESPNGYTIWANTTTALTDGIEASLNTQPLSTTAAKVLETSGNSENSNINSDDPSHFDIKTNTLTVTLPNNIAAGTYEFDIQYALEENPISTITGLGQYSIWWREAKTTPTNITITGTNLSTAQHAYIDLNRNSQLDDGERCTDLTITSNTEVICVGLPAIDWEYSEIPNQYIYDMRIITKNFGQTINGEEDNFEYYPQYLKDVVSENRYDVTTMQGLTESICQISDYNPTNYGNNTDNTVTLTDTRNDQLYDVRHMVDTKCWMIDNLKLQLSSGMLLTPATSAVEQNITVQLAADNIDSNGFTTSGFLTTDSSRPKGTDSSPLYDAWRQVDPSNQEACANGSAYHTDSKSGCGYIYNYYTATAGSFPSNNLGSDDMGNATQSICPASWRLPVQYIAPQDYAVLGKSLNQNKPIYGDYNGWGSTNSQAGKDGAFRGTYAGLWYTTGGLEDVGKSGRYYTSRGMNYSSQITAVAADSGNFGEGGYGRGYGFSIRCVVGELRDNPTITALSPTNVDHNTPTTITITGTNFVKLKKVFIDINQNDQADDGEECTNPTVISDTKITCKTPTVSADQINNSYPVRVQTEYGLSPTSQSLTYVKLNYLAQVVANNNITTMQALTITLCAAADYDNYNVGANENNTVILTDTRNNQAYLIRKMADKSCWMIDNLKLADVTLTSSDSNVAADFTLPSTIQTGNGSYTEPIIYDPSSIDTCQEPARGTTYNITSQSGCGYLYNWCAATATAATCYATPQYAVAFHDICPTNWHMPLIYPDGLSGDFHNLITALGNNILNVVPNGVWQGALAGIYLSDAPMFNGSGIGVHYWSAGLQAQAPAAYTLTVFSLPGTSQYYGLPGVLPRHFGASVRCLVGNSLPTPPQTTDQTPTPLALPLNPTEPTTTEPETTPTTSGDDPNQTPTPTND
jgi:uncharacterized protein (TIGR02145 family)